MPDDSRVDVTALLGSPARREIKIGDRVRSFDFAGQTDAVGERGDFVEGVVVDFVVRNGSLRYGIQVDRDVSSGGDKAGRVGSMVYPPMNGTPISGGGMTAFVVLLSVDREKRLEEALRRLISDPFLSVVMERVLPEELKWAIAVLEDKS